MAKSMGIMPDGTNLRVDGASSVGAGASDDDDALLPERTTPAGAGRRIQQLKERKNWWLFRSDPPRREGVSNSRTLEII